MQLIDNDNIKKIARRMIIGSIIIAFILPLIDLSYGTDWKRTILIFVLPLLFAFIVHIVYYFYKGKGPWVKTKSPEELKEINWMIIVARDPDNNYIS